jgi:hypothetical protein
MNRLSNSLFQRRNLGSRGLDFGSGRNTSRFDASPLFCLSSVISSVCRCSFSVVVAT